MQMRICVLSSWTRRLAYPPELSKKSSQTSVFNKVPPSPTESDKDFLRENQDSLEGPNHGKNPLSADSPKELEEPSEYTPTLAIQDAIAVESSSIPFAQRSQNVEIVPDEEEEGGALPSADSGKPTLEKAVKEPQDDSQDAQDAENKSQSFENVSYEAEDTAEVIPILPTTPLKIEYDSPVLPETKASTVADLLKNPRSFKDSESKVKGLDKDDAEANQGVRVDHDIEETPVPEEREAQGLGIQQASDSTDLKRQAPESKTKGGKTDLEDHSTEEIIVPEAEKTPGSSDSKREAPELNLKDTKIITDDVGSKTEVAEVKTKDAKTETAGDENKADFDFRSQKDRSSEDRRSSQEGHRSRFSRFSLMRGRTASRSLDIPPGLERIFVPAPASDPVPDSSCRFKYKANSKLWTSESNEFSNPKQASGTQRPSLLSERTSFKNS